MPNERVQAVPILTKSKALFDSFRLYTRIWFDTITPLTMLILIRDHAVGINAYVLTILAVVSFHAGHTFFNDISDVEVDRQSLEYGRKNRPLVQGVISPRDMMVAGWFFIALSIIIILNLPTFSIIVAVLALPLVLAYNFEPLHLSARPIWTQLFWPAIWVLMFVLCTIAMQSSGWGKALPYLGFVVLFMGLGESLTQDIRDVDNDAKGGRRTSIVQYGVSQTVFIAWAFQFLALLLWIGFVLNYPLPLVPGIITTLILAIWLIYFAQIAARLKKQYNKADGRLTHIGSITVFTLINLITIATVI